MSAHERKITWRRAEDGRAFKVTIYDAHREKIVEELKRYYAPTEAESTMDVNILDERGLRLRPIRIQRERRERWAKRERDAQLWRPLA